MSIPELARLPPGVVTLADHGAHAEQVLSANAWAYFSGGAGDEITLRTNRSAWDALVLHPRVLRPMAGGHTQSMLLGRTLLSDEKPHNRTTDVRGPLWFQLSLDTTPASPAVLPRIVQSLAGATLARWAWRMCCGFCATSWKSPWRCAAVPLWPTLGRNCYNWIKG